MLEGINETEGLHFTEDGTIIAGERTIPGDTPVSMNLWAFDPSIMAALQQRWETFYAAHADEPKSECLLPTEVTGLMRERGFEVMLESSPETWTGLTNPDDLETVRNQIATLRA